MDEHECDGMTHVCRSSFRRSLFALTIPYSHFVFSPTIHSPGRSAGFRCPLCLLNLAPLLIIILILIALSAHSPQSLVHTSTVVLRYFVGNHPTLLLMLPYVYSPSSFL